MSHTHSQVITLTGTRQSGVTTSLLEHVEKSLKSNPGKIALILAHKLNVVEMLYEIIDKSFPTIRDSVMVSLPPTFPQLISILNNPPEAGYCGVFADDGYRYLSHEGLMSIAREFPLLDIVVGDSKDSNAFENLPAPLSAKHSPAETTAQPPITDEQIKALALANGFKLKEQLGGVMDLNSYVYDFARALLASQQTDSVKLSVSTHQAFERFAQAMKQDSGYAWSWQCNLAMLIKDASDNAVKHRHANVASAEFLNRIFHIDVTKFKEWEDFERQWSNSGKPVKYLLNMNPTLSILLDNGMVKKVGKVNWDFYSLVGDYLTITDRSEFEIELELYSKILTEWHLQQGTRSICEE